MRHNKSFNHLGRKSSHRKAMLANMASSLIMHKRIETTLAKAKALRVYVEPLITKSKDEAILANIALRWPLLRPKWLNDLLCLIIFYFYGFLFNFYIVFGNIHSE